MNIILIIAWPSCACLTTTSNGAASSCPTPGACPDSRPDACPDSIGGLGDARRDLNDATHITLLDRKRRWRDPQQKTIALSKYPWDRCYDF
jgi:hypothetical protein